MLILNEYIKKSMSVFLILYHRNGGTFLGPPPKVEVLDQNKIRGRLGQAKTRQAFQSFGTFQSAFFLNNSFFLDRMYSWV
ncbi:MAG: hypothetical protein AMS26_12000 [Bacteroides sp. SM23_62]|nr:MAG: hypothetical protein AMS26_12000 [Bacteroides sp. SM23_62]